MGTIIYDDEYHGPRWRYGLQYRGITSYWGCRDGDDPILWILYSSESSEDARFRTFGTYETAAPISDETARMLELVPLGMVDDGLSDEYPNLTAALLRGER